MADVQDGAIWFRTKIQGEQWNYNHPTCRMLLRMFKNLLNPDSGAGLPLKYVQLAIEYAVKEMRQSNPQFIPTNPNIISWTSKNGKSFYDAATDIPDAPPIYEKIAYQSWLDRCRYMIRSAR